MLHYHSNKAYNNAMRIIEGLGTPNPKYGEFLSNVYYPLSTQPEILTNVKFFDGKIVTKTSLDGNIDVKATDVPIQFNPWIFAKSFLPNTVVAKAEHNEAKLLDTAFSVFYYEEINNKRINKLYDVPDFNNNQIQKQISLWTKNGLPPKSLTDPNSFF